MSSIACLNCSLVQHRAASDGCKAGRLTAELSQPTECQNACALPGLPALPFVCLSAQQQSQVFTADLCKGVFACQIICLEQQASD